LLADLPGWLVKFARETSIDVTLVIRNNDPRALFEDVRQRLAKCTARPAFDCLLITGGPNLGFGRGHNENYRARPSDYILFLNDDIGLPHIDWRPQAIELLTHDPEMACVAAAQTPQHINPMFGNGQARPALAVETLKYAEASVLLFSGQIFEQLGMFDERFEWAMCEDTDLSLRAQQLGYRLHWMPMPHEHWRSTSVNSLPASVRSSVLEHNRAQLFAGWAHTLATGKVGGLEVFDLWSQGIGDVFCALPHLRAWLDTLTPDRREHVVINMDCPDLAGLIDLSGVRIAREPDRCALLGTLEPEGIPALHSIRDLNYSLPVNIHPLLSGVLGLPTAGNAGLAAFTDALLRYGRLPRGIPLQCSYCVVHLEFARDHAGRALRPASASAVVARCTQIFDTVVIVGNQRQVAKPRGTGGAEVIDLQGKLSVCQLTAVIAHATCFVGIDSFPAHVAQAAGIRSAVFYGAVHPLARVWDQAKVWPLTAELDCIGCYHKHLESSAPYCMRLDEACGEGPTTDRVEAVLLAMKRNQPFDWRRTQQRFLALQAKWLGYLRHHPAPPDRLLRESTGSNEQVSNMVYKILDCVGELAGSRYHTTAVTTMIERVQRLESALSTRNRELDEMSRLLSQIWHGRRPQVAPEARTSQNSIEIHTMALQQHRCQTWVNGDWLDVEAVDDSPMLHLPTIRACGGSINLQLLAIADRSDTLRISWMVDSSEGIHRAQHTFPVGQEARKTALPFDLATGQLLRLRIDPLSGGGRLKLRGAISGSFEVHQESAICAGTLPVMAANLGEESRHGNDWSAVAGAGSAPPAPVKNAPRLTRSPVRRKVTKR